MLRLTKELPQRGKRNASTLFDSSASSASTSSVVHVHSTLSSLPAVGPGSVSSTLKNPRSTTADSSVNVKKRRIPRLAGASPRNSSKSSLQVYTVEEIVAHRKGKRGHYQYHIKWKGFRAEENTWEYGRNILDKSLIEDYWDCYADNRAQEARVPLPSARPGVVFQQGQANSELACEGNRLQSSPTLSSSSLVLAHKDGSHYHSNTSVKHSGDSVSSSDSSANDRVMAVDAASMPSKSVWAEMTEVYMPDIQTVDSLATVDWMRQDPALAVSTSVVVSKCPSSDDPKAGFAAFADAESYDGAKPLPRSQDLQQLRQTGSVLTPENSGSNRQKRPTSQPSDLADTFSQTARMLPPRTSQLPLDSPTKLDPDVLQLYSALPMSMPFSFSTRHHDTPKSPASACK